MGARKEEIPYQALLAYASLSAVRYDDELALLAYASLSAVRDDDELALLAYASLTASLGDQPTPNRQTALPIIFCSCTHLKCAVYALRDAENV